METKRVKYRLVIEYTVPEGARLSADQEAFVREMYRQEFMSSITDVVDVSYGVIEEGAVS